MGYTERGKFNFKVRHTGAGKPFIYCEPLDGGLSLLNPKNNYLDRGAPNYRLLCLDLADNISWDEAERLADRLNAAFVGISIIDMIDAGY